MALSKKFLGLGFTFSATDKGLEKKLKAVRTELKGIESSLEKINSSNKKFNLSLKPKSTGSASASIGASKSPSQAQKFKESKYQAKTASVFEVQTKASEKFFKIVARNVFKSNTDMFASFSENIRNLKVNLDENGDILLADRKRLFSIAKNLEKIRKIDESLLFRTRIKLFFTEEIPKYFKNVTNSFEDFFRTIGIDFRSMIPDQIKSLSNVINQAILKPLGSLGKKILDMTGVSSFFKNFLSDSSAKQIQQSLLDENKSLRNDISGSSKKATNSLLDKIYKELKENKPEDQKTGIFDKLKGFLGGLLGKTAAFGTMLLGVKGIFSSLKNIGFLKYLFKGMTKFAGLMRFLSVPLLKVATVLAALATAGTFLVNLFKGMTPYLESIKTNLGNLFLNLFQFASKKLEPITNWFQEKLGPIIDAISAKFKELLGFFQNGSFFNSIASIGSGAGQKLGKSFSDATERLANWSNTLVSSETAFDQSGKLHSGLSSLADESVSQSELLAKQVSQTEKSNQLLERMIDALMTPEEKSASREAKAALMSNMRKSFGFETGEEGSY